MTSESRLAVLEAKDSIRELAARYCHAVAAGDLDGLLELFAETAYIEVSIEDEEGRYGKVEGKPAMRDFYSDMVALRPKPYIHNHCVEVNGARATGKCAVEIRGLAKEYTNPNGGYYLDAYINEGGTWKFENRTYHPY